MEAEGFCVLVQSARLKWICWGAFRRNRRKAAFEYKDSLINEGIKAAVTQMPYGQAVGLLREIVFRKCDFRCTKCGVSVTRKTGEMNERQSLGTGGHRTYHNCEVLCRACHTGIRGDHGSARARRIA